MARIRANSTSGGGGGITWDLSSLVEYSNCTESTNQSVTIDPTKRYLVVGTYKYNNAYWQEIHIVEQGVDVASYNNYKTSSYPQNYLTISVTGTTMSVQSGGSRAISIFKLD